MEGLPSEIQVDPDSLDLADWWAESLMKQRRGEPLPAPLGVVRPRNEEEVGLTIRWAIAQGVAVIPRGGGSGVCGGAGSRHGAILLDMTGLSEIIEIDENSAVVVAQAGISGPALEGALGAKGLTLGHVPQSFHLSTLGGWIATKATGQMSTKYGGIEERILALRAILPAGRLASSKESPRASVGPEWWRLLVGSEGTLGLVTQATLSAFPIPERHMWVEVKPHTFESGLEILQRVIQSGVRPAVARLYDSADAAVNFGSLGLNRPIMLFRLEGSSRIIEAESEIIEALCLGAVIEEVGAGAHWWDHRFKAADTYRTILSGAGVLGPFGVIDTMEVAARWTLLPVLYEKVRSALGAKADAVLAHASHLYPSGANIYFTFLISSAADELDAQRRYEEAWIAGMEATISTGGTISHHHGVGLLKVPWIRRELGTGYEVIERIKKSFDPNGLMNPGVLGL